MLSHYDHVFYLTFFPGVMSVSHVHTKYHLRGFPLTAFSFGQFKRREKRSDAKPKNATRKHCLVDHLATFENEKWMDLYVADACFDMNCVRACVFIWSNTMVFVSSSKSSNMTFFLWRFRLCERMAHKTKSLIVSIDWSMKMVELFNRF